MSEKTTEKMGRMSGKHLRVLIICCLLAAASLGLQSNVAGVYYTPVSDDLGIGRGAFTMHMTILTLTCAVVTLFVPAIISRVDFKKLLVGSILVNAAGTALMGAVSSTTLFYILGAVRGIAMSFFFSVPITMVINNWFVKNHGMITSLAFSFSGIAGALFSPILTYLIGAIGWRFTYVLNGAVMIVLGLPAMLLGWHMDPRDDGLVAYGYTGASAEGKTETETREPVRASLFSVAFFALFVRAVFVAGITSVAQHFPGYMSSVGLTALSATILSAAMVGNIGFKFLLGILSDKLGAFRGVVTMIVLTLIGLSIITFMRDPKVVLAGALLFGASYSVGSVGTPLLTRTFFGEENYNKMYPPIAFATNVGYSVIMVIVGFMYDSYGSYTAALILSFVMIALIFGGLFLAKNTCPVEEISGRSRRKEARKLEKEEKKAAERRAAEEEKKEEDAPEPVREEKEEPVEAPSEGSVPETIFDYDGKEPEGPSDEEKYDIFKEDLNPHLELKLGEGDDEKIEIIVEE